MYSKKEEEEENVGKKREKILHEMSIHKECFIVDILIFDNSLAKLFIKIILIR